MFCSQCGSSLDDGSKFCHTCGAKVAGDTQAPAPQPQAPHKNKRYLGIIAVALLLTGIGWGIYHFAFVNQANSEEETVPADPIRENISAELQPVKYPASDMQKYLEQIQGDWYDDNGHKLVAVQDNHINDCEVVMVYNMVGSTSLGHGTFRLRENEQEWDVRLGWNLRKSPGDSLSVNGNLMLHKTTDYYYESIGGIHLGMSPEAVKKKLGEPTQILDKDNPVQIGSGKYYAGWCYKDKGLIINFKDGGADRITLPKGSKLRFDKSGLNCNNSLEEFAKAYSMHSVPQWPQADDYYTSPCGIGNGEYMYFGKNMQNVTLTIYY